MKSGEKYGVLTLPHVVVVLVLPGRLRPLEDAELGDHVCSHRVVPGHQLKELLLLSRRKLALAGHATPAKGF